MCCVMAKALCSIEELCASFPTFQESFFWIGAANHAQILDRESEIAKARPTRCADTRLPCEGKGTPSFLVFDVETDGGAPKQLAIQLAYIVYDDRHDEIFRFDKLLSLPAGKKVNFFSTKIHKITENLLFLRGVDPAPEIRLFFQWVEKVQAHKQGRIIAHNAAFDAAVISNTAAQNGLAFELAKSDCFCTMLASKQLCGLVNKRGSPKNPKNSELYEILHGHPPTARLHDALEDVRVTAASYKAGCENGWW